MTDILNLVYTGAVSNKKAHVKIFVYKLVLTVQINRTGVYIIVSTFGIAIRIVLQRDSLEQVEMSY